MDRRDLGFFELPAVAGAFVQEHMIGLGSARDKRESVVGLNIQEFCLSFDGLEVAIKEGSGHAKGRVVGVLDGHLRKIDACVGVVGVHVLKGEAQCLDMSSGSAVERSRVLCALNKSIGSGNAKSNESNLGGDHGRRNEMCLIEDG